MTLKRFGQYVRIEVKDEKGMLVFISDELRIDFDILDIENFTRAKFVVYNLSPDMVKQIGDSSKNNFVSLYTRLHNGSEHKLASNLYVSNALEEKIVPNSLFNIYCYSKLAKDFLEKQIEIYVKKATVEKEVTEALRKAGFSGNIEFRMFPEEVLKLQNPRELIKRTGSVLSIMQVLGKEYNFKFYTINEKIVCLYIPKASEVPSTSLLKGEQPIKLSVTNMRSNPKIGPASLKVDSNLDSRIKPATVLDVSDLLTAGTDSSTQDLQVAENLLRDSVAGFSRYQVLQVRNKGSNYTREWGTMAEAVAPTEGTTMRANDKWWL